MANRQTIDTTLFMPDDMLQRGTTPSPSVESDDLDEAAILKWGEFGFEAHHLIRNVHSAAMDEMTRYSIHANLASHWSDIPGHEARAFEMHHRISSGQTLDLELAPFNTKTSAIRITSAYMKLALGIDQVTVHRGITGFTAALVDEDP